MFAKLDEIKVKLGVGAELCQILMHEIEELVDKVDGLISSSERAALKSKRTKLNLIRNIEKKKETLQPHKFKVKFLLILLEKAGLRQSYQASSLGDIFLGNS